MSLNEQKPEERALDIEPPSEYRGRYDGPSPIKLRIATGGAGQSGLLQALADAFINQLVDKTKCEPFTITWLTSDTTESIEHLQGGGRCWHYLSPTGGN